MTRGATGNEIALDAVADRLTKPWTPIDLAIVNEGLLIERSERQQSGEEAG